MTTTPPDVVKVFEKASFSVTVTIAVEVPSAVNDVGDVVTTEVAVDAAPGETVKLAEVPDSLPPEERVAVIVVPAPAVVKVIVRDDRTPAVNAGVVPPPEEISEVDVRSTVPEKDV
jgi:hypothetical protein